MKRFTLTVLSLELRQFMKNINRGDSPELLSTFFVIELLVLSMSRVTH